MPTRDEIMQLLTVLFDQWVGDESQLWIALYRLLLDYEHGVPRIADSNRLKQGVWRERALQVQSLLARGLALR